LSRDHILFDPLSACGKATKGAAGRETGAPHKGKSTGKEKEAEESGRK